jgi:hypothetical protein
MQPFSSALMPNSQIVQPYSYNETVLGEGSCRTVNPRFPARIQTSGHAALHSALIIGFAALNPPFGELLMLHLFFKVPRPSSFPQSPGMLNDFSRKLVFPFPILLRTRNHARLQSSPPRRGSTSEAKDRFVK